MRVGDQDNRPSSLPALSFADGLAQSLYDPLLLIGRVLAGAIFLNSGFHKTIALINGDLTWINSTIARGLPAFLAYPGGVIELIGGLALVLGLGTRYAALLLILFTIIATYIGHAYWTFPPAQQAAQFTQFMKNTSMLGGLFALFLLAGGRFSLDGLLQRKSKS